MSAYVLLTAGVWVVLAVLKLSHLGLNSGDRVVSRSVDGFTAAMGIGLAAWGFLLWMLPTP